MSKIKDNYDNGDCPDCGEIIPDDMITGGECKNCGHVFQDEMTPIEDSIADLIAQIKFKVTTRNMPKTDTCNVFNELLAALKSEGDCDLLHDKACQTAELLLNLAGFKTEEEEE